MDGPSRWFRRIALGICTIFLFPLLADWLKHWSESWQVYNNPLGFLARALHALAAIAETPWAQWIFFFVVGITVGLWTDWLLRKLTTSHESGLRSLGYDLRSMAYRIESGLSDYYEWPIGLGIPRGELISIFLRVGTAGFWTPSNEIFERKHGGKFLANYFDTLGTLLRDGHFDAAKELSQDAEKQFQFLQ